MCQTGLRGSNSVLSHIQISTLLPRELVTKAGRLLDTTSYQEEELVSHTPSGRGNVVLIFSKPYFYWLLLCKRRTLLLISFVLTAI
jgi:hypothetical protein